jgi:ribosomal protein S18 acetylase RimI-like enzyme
MEVLVVDVHDASEKSKICRMILEQLPQWFGIPEAIYDYCEGVKNHSFLKLCDRTDPIGFASVKVNNEYVAEIYVMGILATYHHQGIGTMLINHIEADLRRRQFQYMEVKTLNESRESEEYRKTRQFYRKVGFIPIDTLYHEWGKENPCLIMIKSLSVDVKPRT